MSIAAGQIVTEEDLQDMQDAGFEKPIVRLIQVTAQSIPAASGTDTSLTFGTGSTDIDTHAFHSEVTNNTRVTPTVEGIYRVTGCYCTVALTTGVSLGIVIGKNGTNQAPRSRKQVSNGALRTVEVSTLLSANGTTDYFELRATQDSAAATLTSVGSSYASIFEVEFVRGPE